MQPVKKRTQIYNAEIVAGSLLMPESRKIARLFLSNADEDTWHKAIEVKNILQKRFVLNLVSQTLTNFHI